MHVRFIDQVPGGQSLMPVHPSQHLAGLRSVRNDLQPGRRRGVERLGCRRAYNCIKTGRCHAFEMRHRNIVKPNWKKWKNRETRSGRSGARRRDHHRKRRGAYLPDSLGTLQPPLRYAPWSFLIKPGKKEAKPKKEEARAYRGLSAGSLPLLCFEITVHGRETAKTDRCRFQKAIPAALPAKPSFIPSFPSWLFRKAFSGLSEVFTAARAARAERNKSRPNRLFSV
jgi:hypothetical protein